MTTTTNPDTMTIQNTLAALLGNPHLGLQGSVLDDWLADELSKSGILQNFHLPQSPPLTISSPLEEKPNPVSTPSTASRSSPSAEALPFLLFPEIQDTKPLSRRYPTLAARPVPIMPKTTADETKVAIPIAPKPACAVGKRKPEDKEENDIALKRKKNTDAARRSRLKKLIKMQSLEQRVAELEGENSQLTTRVAVLESEKSGLESKDNGLTERIRNLETQLAEAHKALTSRQT
ncbi:uncharacterized protein BYT42DRAFT_590136 [Radiomyces spectabilis]|uniref:uncharacterized protein n=1 Tax=Radiomyces spectabilis TaxID=64574 RepID=UPI00221E6FB8|nr:uncharacterized protein BYT42DRAFT_590136 [Radiomyces spectabilis]KAI8364715.1 hypothetical protein BYT42DRAFT_590136 [Radiomyces spectabilis]